jgi:hypothetical protein
MPNGSQIVNNTNFSEINNLLSQGRDMDYIAKHYCMDLALAWSLRLAGIVSAMQKKRILGVTSRYLIIAKKR